MFDNVKSAIEELQKGKIIIVCDDENRENEGDFVALAEYATPEVINFMATHGRGLICVPVDEEIAHRLELHPMTMNNTDPHGTAFTISVDHKSSTTGISAFERSTTVKELIHSESKPEDFKRPGHIFPLLAKNGGVIERPGHTEAAVDLARLAGSPSAGVICEIMNDDGTMARVPQLEKVAERFGLKMITIKDLILFRKQLEQKQLPNVLPL